MISLRKSFIERIPGFSIILITAVLIVIGAALIPLLPVSYLPTQKQDMRLSVSFSWPGASPIVIEQELTSKIEGMVSSVAGVEQTYSTSQEGNGIVNIKLKKGANISAVRFEIMSLLKQIGCKLPLGSSYPILSGGDVENTTLRGTQQVLSYIVNADMDPAHIRNYVERNIKPLLTQIDYVREVEITGISSDYLDISYHPEELKNYGLTPSDIINGLQLFLGKRAIIGDVNKTDSQGCRERITLLLDVEQPESIGKTPIITIDNKIIYLNDITTVEYKKRKANNFYRINGLNTINLTVSADADVNIIKASAELRAQMEEIKKNLTEGFYIIQTDDAAEEVRKELKKLITRTFLSLLILFILIRITNRSGRYLSIITLSLIANVLIAVIFFYLFRVELNLVSIAGIAVSFGIIIDTTIVIVDHYSYYHNRNIFIAILAALLTTIGALVIIFFMPDYVRSTLNDFTVIIIINLVVSLFVSFFFVPTLIDRLKLNRKEWSITIKQRRRNVWLNHIYTRYIRFTQKRKWIYFVLLIAAFGLPIHLLPPRIGNYTDKKSEHQWYEKLYNTTIGSNFYQSHLRSPLEKWMGGALRLFTSRQSGRTFSSYTQDIVLHISAQLSESGDAEELNRKIVQMERFLAQFNEIKKFTTQIRDNSGSISVEFSDEVKHSTFPKILESKVIAEALTIGGADWQTSGVSNKGFSNSLNLSKSRSRRICISGYNYEQLNRYAEMIANMVKKEKRAYDVGIEPGDRTSRAYGYQDDQSKEMYINYDRRKVLMYDIDLTQSYQALANLLQEGKVGIYRIKGQSASIDIDYHSSLRNEFDVWHLMNSYVDISNTSIRYSHIGEIEYRPIIPHIAKNNQEYSLDVAFNFRGDFDRSDAFIKKTTEEVNTLLPIGFRTVNASEGWYHDKGVQYWLILLIVVIIFFICAILFESIRQPLIIILQIPVAFIGTFLTFYFSGVNFGTGGFASLVLLSGLVVNAGIYIVNEYNNISSAHSRSGRRVSAIKLYIKAYNHKITAVMLTVLSTVLGLTPFLLDGPKAEPFWFSFAIGTMGGLLFSILTLIFFMPILMNFGKDKEEKAIRREVI